MSIGLREKQVLESIIDFYLKSGEAVGSRTLVKNYGMNLSAATIRNVMADLESEGYIEKSHTSSGRRPTNKGYKLYIDTLLEIQRLSSEELREMKKSYQSFDISSSTKALSHLTSHTSFALEPNVLKDKLNKIELIYLNNKSFLAVVVTDNAVNTKKIDLSQSIREEDINNLSRYMNNVFRGQALENIVIGNNIPLRSETQLLQGFLNQIESNVHLEGSESIINYLAKSGADLSSYRVFQAKDEMKSFLEKLVDNSHENKINIILGDDIDSSKLSGLSFIFSTYEKGNSKGMLGIVGPKRMQYSKIAGLVESITKQLEDSSKKEIE